MPRVLTALVVFSVLAAPSRAGQQPPGWQPPPPTPTALQSQGGTWRTDSVQFTLQPDEGMEYKYRLERGAALLFSWRASAGLHYELHSVPDGAPKDFAETFDKQDDRPGAHGSYLAPFSGIHGWYWQNRGDAPVTLTLTAAGYFTESQEYRRNQDPKRKTF